MRKPKYSRIIAGCMSWGKWGKQFSTEEQIDLIQYYKSVGITTFDHADIYGDYTTEAQFGEAFRKSGIVREEIQLISKCGIQYLGEARGNEIKHYNYNEEYILWSVEESLKNLQTEYLDLLLLHRPSPLMQPDKINKAVTILKNQGKILDFGVSNFTPSQVDLILDKTAIGVNQIEFSLTQHTAMHNGSLDQMLQKSIIPMSWSPLGNVFKENTEQTKRVKECLLDLISKYNCTEDQILLAWLLKHPTRIHPVIGTTNKERIQNAVRATEINLELEDWFKLLVASQGHKVP
jgi:predicted oxidoreductase